MDKTPLRIVLDNIRSMHNVGSVFRTADAFATEHLHLCGFTPKPPHRDIRKTAIGAEETISWSYHKDISDPLIRLKEEGWTLIAVEQTDKSIALKQLVVNSGSKIALIFGNEVEGVSHVALELCDSALEIEQYGTKHSLNVSVTVGIVTQRLSELLR